MTRPFGKLLVLTPDAYGGRGGIALYNRDVIDGLASHPGVDQVVVLPRHVPDLPSHIPARVSFRKEAAGGKLRYARAFLRTRQDAFHAVFCMHINLLPLARRAARRCNALLVLWIYGIDAWHPELRSSARRALSHVDEVISISDVTLDKFRAWHEVDRARCCVMPNAIHLDRYAAGPAPQPLVDRYGLRDRTVLLTLGRLSASEQYKGVDQVVDVLPELAREIPSISYLVVGDGTDRARLEARAHDAGLSDRVTFAGWIPEHEKADHYRLAHAYVMPSQGEGFGFVFLEALACGIPVVASDLDGGREAVREGALGVLVDPRDRDSLLRGIRTALNTPRGSVPEGLSFFGVERFRERLHDWMATRLGAA